MTCPKIQFTDGLNGCEAGKGQNQRGQSKKANKSNRNLGIMNDFTNFCANPFRKC